jgi:hypothetical protein
VSVGFYMDVHVPASITRGLLLRGVDVLTAQLDGTTQLDDPRLLDRATELGLFYSVKMMTCLRRPQSVSGAGSYLAA